MWPYVRMAVRRFENHRVAAVLIVLSSATRGVAVGAGVTVGARDNVGAGVGAQVPAAFCWTPHDVDSHPLEENAEVRSTPLSTHQPRSWSKAGGAEEHVAHVLDAVDGPITYVLVKCRGPEEHIFHRRDLVDPPVAQRLVEGVGTVEHRTSP